MFDSTYHMTLELHKNCSFGLKTSRICDLFHNVLMEVITYSYLICKLLWFTYFIAWRYITPRRDIM